jgi:hypothetical protein
MNRPGSPRKRTPGRQSRAVAARSRASPWLLAVLAALVVVAVLVLFAPKVQAADIILDGQFADWDGQMFLPDPHNDAHWKADIAAFYWATNPGEEAMYFMAERWPQGNMGQSVTYCVHFCPHGASPACYDTAADWQLTCHYDPDEANNALVRIFRGDQSLRDDTPAFQYQGHWGLSAAEGGTKVEFRVAFADVGVGVGQPIRMFLASVKDDEGKQNPHLDTCPDTGDIQWAPVHTLGLVLTVLLLGAGLVLGYRSFRYGRSALWFPRKAVQG